MVAALRQLSITPGSSLAKLAAWLGVGLVLLPIVPGLMKVLAPALHLAHWQALLADNQFPLALQATLLSAFGSTLLALVLALLLAATTYPDKGWHKLRQRLPWLLAFPHAAFAIGLAFLLAPSGWLARWLAPLFAWTAPPAWVTVQDPYSITLTLALALKESWFLLWVLAALLGEQHISQQITVARSMGYGRWQAWWQLVVPQLLPRLGWPLLAVFAYSLSVVDMALILGPSTPPTLAVFGWQWFSDPQTAVQAKGSVLALLLLVLLLAGLLAGRGLRLVLRGWLAIPAGRRWMVRQGYIRRYLPTLLLAPGWLALCMLLLWSLAGAWFFPAIWPQQLSLQGWWQADWQPLWTTLGLAAASVLLALPLALLWLEWGPRAQGWLYFPLILPALPMAMAQYHALLSLNLDNTASAVIWSHLAWVLPYTILMLSGAYRSFDVRLLLTARALGYSHWQACWRVKWPMLLRPILAAAGVGFAVSIAQYLPTLFAGGGRIETVTTEAVALSAGGCWPCRHCYRLCYRCWPSP